MRASIVSVAISPLKRPAKLPPEMGSSLSSVGPPSPLAATWNSRSTFLYAAASASCASSRPKASSHLNEAAARSGEAAHSARVRGVARGAGVSLAEVWADNVDAVEGVSAVLHVLVVLCEAFRRHRVAHGLREDAIVVDAEEAVDVF